MRKGYIIACDYYKIRGFTYISISLLAAGIGTAINPFITCGLPPLRFITFGDGFGINPAFIIYTADFVPFCILL